MIQLAELHRPFQNNELSVIENRGEIGADPEGGLILAIKNSSRSTCPDRATVDGVSRFRALKIPAAESIDPTLFEIERTEDKRRGLLRSLR